MDATSSITGNALFAGNATTFTTVNGGVGTGLMTITAGTATFNGTVTTGGLTQSGGELNGTGTLTVTGTGPVPASSFSNGTQSGSGTTLAQNGATFSSTGFGLDGGRTLQLGGASTTSGASVQINLNSSNPNNSVSDVGSGTLTILSGATFTDATTGGLTIFTTNHGTGDTGVTAAVNNAGTFTKSGSAATSTISTLFNNTGTVNVTSGTLNLSGGGTDSGALNLSSGATVQFSSAYTLDGASSKGLGQILLASSTVTINATANFASGFTEFWWHAGWYRDCNDNGALDIFEWHANGFWDDNCTEWCNIQFDALRTGWWSDAATGRRQHDEWTKRSGQPEQRQSEH